MTFEPDIRIHEAVSNQRLTEVFGCGPQGGMRRSLKTNTLVLISNHVESIYDDRWIDGVLHYTGMGMEGNQSLDFMQNKTLASSNSNGVAVHLFEVFRERQYVYAGPVVLAGAPYQETQPDQRGVDRQVWVFPLRPENADAPRLPQEIVEAPSGVKHRKAKRLTDTELLKRAQKAHRLPGQRTVEATQHDRNPWVAEYAKRRAGGCCDLCGESAPFKGKDGDPYLENHHVVWLARGGEDTAENTVALCPNCHRKMHVLDRDEDCAFLLKKYRA